MRLRLSALGRWVVMPNNMVQFRVHLPLYLRVHKKSMYGRKHRRRCLIICRLQLLTAWSGWLDVRYLFRL
jgi:hypothetical protein